MYEWHGDRMQAVSSSDSAENEYGSSSDSEDSQQSQDGNSTSEHESDLGGFIVAEEPDADDRQPNNGDAGPGPSAVSALLEEAGMVSSRTDKEHFVIYVEYLVYDLVDITFAVRVRGDSRLRKHFDTAVRHVEESLAFKRCAAQLVLPCMCQFLLNGKMLKTAETLFGYLAFALHGRVNDYVVEKYMADFPTDGSESAAVLQAVHQVHIGARDGLLYGFQHQGVAHLLKTPIAITG